MYNFVFFIVMLTHMHALVVARFLLAIFSGSVWYCANKASATVPAEMVTNLLHRLDAQVIKYQVLQSLIAQQESKIASMSESHRELQFFYERDGTQKDQYICALAFKEREIEELDEVTPTAMQKLKK
ncbi:hypothetical protein IWW43_004524 [Coemansia sp. RSA 1935]|nr:hypothetical protein IWW43_004524 [Coemansia sp. RSA 1935]KAJ2644130.1 hypothetical protein IW137_002174 [Coemansia sp. RSA 1287]